MLVLLFGRWYAPEFDGNDLHGDTYLNLGLSVSLSSLSLRVSHGAHYCPPIARKIWMLHCVRGCGRDRCPRRVAGNLYTEGVHVSRGV